MLEGNISTVYAIVSYSPKRFCSLHLRVRAHSKQSDTYPSKIHKPDMIPTPAKSINQI